MSRRRQLTGGWRMLAGTGTGASVALGLLVLVTVFVSIALPRGSLSLRTHALHQTIAQLPPSSRTVTVDIDYGSFVQAVGGSGVPAELAQNRQVQTQALVSGGVPIDQGASWSDLSTGQLPTSGAAHSAYFGASAPQFVLRYRDSLRRYARLVAGTWPATGTSNGRTSTLQAVVTPATAQRFSLHVGSHLGLGPDLAMVVSGIVRPLEPSSAYWQELGGTIAPFFTRDLISGIGNWTGSAIVSAAEANAIVGPEDYNTAQCTWVYPVDFSHLSADHVSGTLQQLTSAMGQASTTLTTPGAIAAGLNVNSGVAPALAAFITAQNADASLLSLLLVSLAVLGVVVLLMCTELLGERRDEELMLMRARGATPAQLGWLVFRGGLLATVPAAVLGIGLALVLTPGSNEPLAWWLATLTLLTALGAPAVRAVRTAGGRKARRGAASSRRVAVIRRLIIEVTLIGLAVAGLIVLRQQGLSANGSVNALASAAPVLVAVPIAIVVVRLCPLVLGWLQHAAGRSRGVVAFVGLVRGTQRALAAMLPVFALVLALGVVAFGGTVRAAVNSGEQAAAWQQAGGDAVVGSPTAAISLPVPAQRAIAAVRGVRRTAPVVELPAGTGINQATGASFNVALVNPAQYAALLAQTPAAPFDASALARPKGPVSRIPVLASPDAAALLRRSGGVATINDDTVKLAVKGLLSSTPAAPSGAPFVVAPLWSGITTLPPTMLLLTGPNIDRAQLNAVAARTAPGAVVTFRQQLLSTLVSAPLPSAAYLAYGLGSAVAAIFSILVVLIALLLGARTRELVDARMATMGLSAGQARRVGIVEATPFILAGALGGVVAALALIPLIGPVLDLSAFTGTPRSVSLVPDVSTLAIAAAGLALLALATLAGQAAAASRRGVARSLRVGE